ncbi:longevity assurance proteins LAG1/LAC1 [Rhodotorula diobovata]|uniref:Longevity assurance proteins LAG1/LAC1 n=1 Tax=Rhodotorula diobovata TaxID=5288 RepID=A0A5C5FK59_9BASI|nr:longevity assurance proteins LAG1/LAC1 [Rhodotorula diobovata]
MAARKRATSIGQDALNELDKASQPVGTTATAHNSQGARRGGAAAKGGSQAQPWTQATGPLAWLVKPKCTLPIIAATVAAWAALEHSSTSPSSTSPLKGGSDNPLTPLLWISYALPPIPGDASSTRYGKGPKDLLFLGFYIIVFSFVRQALTEYLLRPLARALGLKTEGKITRFMEQAYAVVYFSWSGAFGLYVMSRQPSWWYNTEHFWLGYPHWRMDGPLKTYYLLQFSYWLQQMIILVMRLEKPRVDFRELVIHHIVTLWLVGWSYMINLTMIGTAVFVSMDLPDICLAFSKCLNYLDLQRTSEASFVFFLFIWTYMRHYLNCRILWSVWTQFDLVPAQWRNWSVDHNGWWLFYGFGSGEIPKWMKYQIFAPILALQLVNAFWTYLILRILVRILSGKNARDVREEDEDEQDRRELAELEAREKAKGGKAQ